jgi:high-affinity Fe2+/Pb2+ permease
VTGFQQGAFAIAMVAAMILAYFGVRLAMRPDDRLRGVLMVIAAVVLVGNVAIWTV